jgi:chromosome segregation protein
VLKLKRVELQGFKSFCDRSEMRFHGAGIAAVVGPNGCGKSNLSDAISWVLGEQSAKSLRGSRMEDVIFAGTRDRKPVGMASVTMTMVDPSVHAEFPVHSDTNGHGNHAHSNGSPVTNNKEEEITITRRLYRSGESEYLINGRHARLRDIQDLFMGSGLGPESYAIIEQGRIGQILSTKPQDRRAVIEEAAGITRFKTKKRLAEAKLESAKANLTRVFDILEEVSRQVNSLKRQAAKAKRYGELKTELVAQLRIALSGRFRMLERELTKIALDLNMATGEFQKLNTEIGESEKRHTALQEHTYAIEAKLTEARKQLAEFRVEAERVRGRLESQARQISSIEDRLSRGDNETQDLEKRFEHQQLELAQHSERLVEVERMAQESQHALALKSEERDRWQGQLRERERGLEASRQHVLKLLGEASTLKNQLAQIDQYLVGINRDVERIQRDEANASNDRERIEALKAELTQKQSVRQLELQTTIEQRRTIDEELLTRKARAAEARRKLEELRAETSRLKARRDSLEEVLSHRSYTTESVKRLFKAVEKGQARDFTPIGVLADFVEVDAAHEKAAEEFLHEELEYVVVKDWEQAERGIAYMRSDMDGRATFLIHPETNETIPQASIASPAREQGIVAKLADVLRLTNGLSGAPADLLPRLSRCFIAEDRSAAQRLSFQYPDSYFLLNDGVCYHGHAVSGGKKTGSGPLGLKRELREVSNQHTAKQKEFDKTKSLLEDLDLEMSQLTEDLERLRGQQQRQEKDAVSLDHEIRKMTEEFNRANSRLSVARTELQRLMQERERSAARREQNEKLVAEKEQARVEQEQSLAEARAALEELRHDVGRLSEEHSAFRVELAGLEERRRAEQSARQRLENQIRDIAHRRQQLTHELERLGVEKARLLSDNIDLDSRAAELAKHIADGDAVASELAAQESKGRSELAAADESLRISRQEMQAASDRRSHIELNLVKKQAELKYLEETCNKQLGCTLQEVAEGDETLLDEVGLVEVEQKCQDLTSKIDALGPVNTEALEQYDEAQQRYDFLNAQRQDLLDSIRDTEKTIGEIDVEARKRFTEAFELINANFREMFKTLFGGGIGEMRLSDAENAIESGIDIVASPPGKKLQSVLLLSGGERALTAMALLMAIFKYQPSPFCVLDEVDAPLDEANIDRLTRLLKEMSAQTQFIVITHSKRTMESAQALYGVTMQEPGVSKLVSVKFNPPPPPPVPVMQPQLLAN